MVYINGDTSLPGCAKCSGRIDIQRFLTEVSVDAGTEPGSASASFSLSVPLHHTDSFARDAKFLLRPGLEVHIYMRGYFPVTGLYSNLAEGRLAQDVRGSADISTRVAAAQANAAGAGGSTAKEPRRPDGSAYTIDDLTRLRDAEDAATRRRLETTSAMMMTVHQYLEQQGYVGVDLEVSSHGGYKSYNPSEKREATSQHFVGNAVDFTAYHQVGGQRQKISDTIVWASIDKLRDAGKLPTGARQGAYLKAGQTPTADPVWTGSPPHMDHKPGKRGFEWIRVGGEDVEGSLKTAWLKALRTNKAGLPEPDSSVGTTSKNRAGSFPGDAPPPPVTDGIELATDDGTEATGVLAPSLLEEMGLQGMGVENTLAYPYYHVFHGVVTEVSHSYSGGVNSVSVNCNSMLHFWQYQNMSTNASVFGARPRNSKLKMSLVGHNFTGMHPYQIMYTLHHDMVGAAGGVAWALSSKTNQSAASPAGESLFSLNIRYWERRFSQRMIKLRMHGATGELFSTMAAAWLGRTSSASIMGLVRNRFNKTTSDRTKRILEQSRLVGMNNKGKRNALNATVWAPRTAGRGEDNKPKFELNIVEMQAFVSNIGNWGQVNLFESSYESKLDIAQKVMEITGFEFYQDVDGDFVFKPPMWNLDTSGSRVYRIENIDIISISFSEKEPQATYMTCKGSQFKNMAGTGLENEWGVRGQYIDYRLVAQFGWRPGSYETAYFNDSKSMFFAAVNRMDVMNIGVNSASLTIPERPEIRPGYPVYVRYLDCFYYCNSFSHGHAVGGQCTTALQLVGKRAKFYAPGNRAGSKTGPTSGGINDINLGDTILPQRPLQVTDPDGKPRLSGFPNVVMALDPTAVNPLYFVVGNDIANLTDTQEIRHLLDVGVQEHVLSKQEEEGGKITYLLDTTSGEEGASGYKVAFYFQEGDINGDAKVPDIAGVPEGQSFSLIRVANEYERLQETNATEQDTLQEALDDQQYAINQRYAELAELRSDPKRYQNPTKYEADEKKVTDAIQDLLEVRTGLIKTANDKKGALEASWRVPGGGGASQGVAYLLRMLDLVGDAYRATSDFQRRGDLSSTVNLLDMLSDKKATFSNGSQPGSYRYYSASHPNPKHQGPGVVSYKTGKKGVIQEGAPAAIEGDNPEILVYSERPNAPFPGAAIPEAELIKGRPTVGIKVLDSSGVPQGRSLATSSIMELMFTVQPISVVTTKTSTASTTNIGTMGADVKAKAAAFLRSAGTSSSLGVSASFTTVFQGSWNILYDRTLSAIKAMRAEATRMSFDITGLSLNPPWLPTSVPIFKATVAMSKSLGDLNYNLGTSAPDPNKISLGAEGGKATGGKVRAEAGRRLGIEFVAGLEAIRKKVAPVLDVQGADAAQIKLVLNTFNNVFAKTLDAKVVAGDTVKVSKTAVSRKTTFSPVFPVSDGRGYEVIGTYRYGRDVSIEPGGVFEQLHKTDVFSLLDKNLVEQILRFFVQNKGYIQTPANRVEVINGVKKTVPVADAGRLEGAGAAKYLNEELIRQLREANLTDKQILDFGFLLNSDDPNVLMFSLSNIFAEGNLDGIQKIPVLNAAYSLADMNVQQRGRVCGCKAAEADVQIAAFGQEKFLSLSQAGTPAHEGLGTDPADAGTRWVAHSASLAAESWRQQQDALRGKVLDNGGSHIVRQFTDVFGIDTQQSGNAFTDALGVQGLDAKTRTSVFEKTLDDADYNYAREGGPLQATLDELEDD